MAGRRGRRGRRGGGPPCPAGSGASFCDPPWPRTPPSTPCAAARRSRVRLGPCAADGQERRLIPQASSDPDGWRIGPRRRRRAGGWAVARRRKLDGVGSKQGSGQVGLGACVLIAFDDLDQRSEKSAFLRSHRLATIAFPGFAMNAPSILACADDCVAYPCMRIENKTDER
jgi:hypothetical protein